MKSIALKRGEGKWVTFNVTSGGVALDLSTATLRFCVKSSTDDTSYLITKQSLDFDRTHDETGVVRVNLSATDTANLGTGSFVGELVMVLAADTDVDKSATVKIDILPSVAHD
jgi:hypothetical protein